VARWHAYEEQSVSELASIRPMLTELHARDPAAATDFAKRYSTGLTYETVAVANSARNDLMTTITVEELGRAA
jgi:dipeptidase